MKKRAAVYEEIHSLIAEALSKLSGQGYSPLDLVDLNTAAFAPSRLTNGFLVSDFPFPGARYFSIVDGHCYHIVGLTPDKSAVLAYRFSVRGQWIGRRTGIAVSISPEGWVAARLVLYQINTVGMKLERGVIQQFGSDVSQLHLSVHLKAIFQHFKERISRYLPARFCQHQAPATPRSST